ncbi:hypothetical protein AAVH_07629 [Aphelenchoides avenae]|nr:hypothetical protein AAVH_07629 [Aphelenchus avenae]
MCSAVVLPLSSSLPLLLALSPLCFAAPDVLGREYYRNRFLDEEVDQGLQSGLSCVTFCQFDVHEQFNLPTFSRPRDFQEYCELAQKLPECFEKCPDSPLVPLLKQDAEINAQICGEGFDESKFKELLQAQDRLYEHWSWQSTASCPGPAFDASGMNTKCSSYLDCFFGEALTAVKDGYEDFVVASVVLPLKLEYALQVGDGEWTQDAVDE